MVVLKGAIKTHSYVRFDHLRYAQRDGGVLVAVATAPRRRRRRSRCQFYIQLLNELYVFENMNFTALDVWVSRGRFL